MIHRNVRCIAMYHDTIESRPMYRDVHRIITAFVTGLCFVMIHKGFKNPVSKNLSLCAAKIEQQISLESLRITFTTQLLRP